ncbi:MAG: TonB-dependent receptor [Bacteroidales bacterium]|nr:TonB-dependent receptor [Bacteroidales bacterium]
MKQKINSLILALILTVAPTFLFAQNSLNIIVKDSTSKELLVGVNILLKGTLNGTTTDLKGNALLKNIPSGTQQIVLSYIGYEKLILHLVFPLKDAKKPINVSLYPESEELEVVTITATRSNSRIEDLPTKVEVLGMDDMEEENSIRPANITSLLGDIGGIQMQQTSASSGNTNTRIQGLNGRYSQILKDGMPLYGGFSGSFSILQVPPLDLRQIEIIKGSASTLYGGDAIGGIINLVSKTPTDKPETNILINRTSLNETDFNSYISRKYTKVGFTFFAGLVNQTVKDVNNDGFSDAPELQNIVLHPKLFYYFDKNSTLALGINSLIENRKGGDMQVLNGNSDAIHQYFVQHKSLRNSGELNFEKRWENGSNLQLKGSISALDRSIENPSYYFKAAQTLYLSELTYFLKREKYDFVFGANFNGDKFNKEETKGIGVGFYSAASIPFQNYNYHTLGLFVQNDWRITNKMLVEGGLRYDNHSTRGGFLLPRLSIMYKFHPDFTMRLNGGLGYKTPLLFSYLNEETDLNNIYTHQEELKTETSQGVNFDINYHTTLWRTTLLTLNQSFFYTQLNHPIEYLTNGTLLNADKPVISHGFQTYARMSVDEFELYLSYVYTHSEKKYDSVNPQFLATPQHNLAGTFVYEPNKKWRFGIESSLIGPQVIENNDKTPTYGFIALMIERKFKHVSIVLNCENVLDYRQKDFVVLPYKAPTFKTLWAPIDGRVINLSVNWKI